MKLRHLLIISGMLLLTACNQSKSDQTTKVEKLTIGVVSYGEGARSVEQYQGFVNYLEGKTKTLIELEPVYNEIKAVDQIQRQAWSLVFAPPGLAAIAISKAQYTPIFPLQGVDNLSSVLVVLKDSPIQKLTDLNDKRVALGQPGSATGYYVPLYNLYGTTLSEVQIASTPKTVLELVAKGKVDAGALSKNEFTRYQSEFSPTQFRILLNSRRIPAGSVLVSPAVGQGERQLIQQAMNDAIPQIVQEVGYVPNAAPPEYKTLITFINKVKPIEGRIRDKPAYLFRSDASEKKTSPN